MAVMRYTIIDKEGTVSFISPWNTLKALVAGCSRKPAPETLVELLEAATKYNTGLQEYVLDGLAVFDEHNAAAQSAEEKVELSPGLERELQALLEKANLPDQPLTDVSDNPEAPLPTSEITYEELLETQRRLRGAAAAQHPVLRVLNEATRHESLEPVGLGLVIFNLPAKRIIQVQNNFGGGIRRQDRGRYFEQNQPTDRLYFYRLPSDWSLLP
ncbi:MAG TPA: hypothetical protein VH186_32085 [Chloroflexia bacterium]|nr:hypothetical protein [Chloroflexia bacterium]